MSAARRIVQLALVPAVTVGCAAPFSDLQSARLAGPNRLEVTPGYSATWVADDGESERVSDNLGVQAALGVHDIADLRLRYERIAAADDDFAVNVFGLGPKVALVPDWIALYAPVGFAFGEDIETSETWQIHPTILGTVPLGEAAELNGSAKVLIPFDREMETLIAFNAGLGLGDLDRWVIRPEVGMLRNPGEEGHVRHLSIGFTYYFDWARPSAAAR